MPDKLKQMQDLFYSEAKKYDVLPLDNSTLARWNTPRPSLTAGQTEFTYSGELAGTPPSAAPSILNKGYTITAEVEIPEGGAEGMIVTEGGRFGGYGLFLSKGEFGVGRGKVVFLYNLLDLKRTTWEGPELEAGKHTIVFDFKPDGPGLGQGRHRRIVGGRSGSCQKHPGPHHPDHVPGGRNLRRGPGHAHPVGAHRVSLRRSVQVHRQDRQADIQAPTGAGRGSEALAASRNCQSGRWRAMKKVLNFAAVAEAATGMALLIVPSLVGRLLLGEDLTGVAIPVARVAGIALIALGVACWPGPPLVGMLIYGVLVTLYLAYLGFAGGLAGIFLWPAVALHAILSVFLGRLWLAGERQ